MICQTHWHGVSSTVFMGGSAGRCAAHRCPLAHLLLHLQAGWVLGTRYLLRAGGGQRLSTFRRSARSRSCASTSSAVVAVCRCCSSILRIKTPTAGRSYFTRTRRQIGCTSEPRLPGLMTLGTLLLRHSVQLSRLPCDYASPRLLAVVMWGSGSMGYNRRGRLQTRRQRPKISATTPHIS